MAVEFLVNRLKNLFVIVLGTLRRALCCFRRRKRSCDSTPLSEIGVVPNSAQRADLEQWEQWGENPVVVVSEKPVDPIQEKILLYRQSFSKKPESSEEENKMNYFENMVPQIKKQKKVVIKQNYDQTQNLQDSKFAVVTEPILTNELGEWDENSAGWEEETAEEFENTNVVLKEEKRREREERLFKQHQKRMKKNTRPQALGAKISS